MVGDELSAAPSTGASGTSPLLGRLCLCGAGVPSGQHQVMHVVSLFLSLCILCFWLPELLGHMDNPGATSSSPAYWLWGLFPLLLGGTLDYQSQPCLFHECHGYVAPDVSSVG